MRYFIQFVFCIFFTIFLFYQKNKCLTIFEVFCVQGLFFLNKKLFYFCYNPLLFRFDDKTLLMKNGKLYFIEMPHFVFYFFVFFSVPFLKKEGSKTINDEQKISFYLYTNGFI